VVKFDIEVFYSLDTKAFQDLNASVKHENKKSTSSYLRRNTALFKLTGQQ